MKRFVLFFVFLLAGSPIAAAPTATAAPPIAGNALLGVSVTELHLVAVGYRASKIIGARVYNDKNQQIGTVRDLVITPDRLVSYAIVAVGGFLGIGQKDVAVQAARFKDLGGKITLPGATKQTLDSLPAFHFSR